MRLLSSQRQRTTLEGTEESKAGSEGSEEEGPYLVLNFCADAAENAAYFARKAVASANFTVFLMQERLRVLSIE